LESTKERDNSLRAIQVLKNLLGIRDEEILESAERELTEIAIQDHVGRTHVGWESRSRTVFGYPSGYFFFPCVVVVGARQTGKSTLMNMFADRREVFDLETRAAFPIISTPQHESDC